MLITTGGAHEAVWQIHVLSETAATLTVVLRVHIHDLNLLILFFIAAATITHKHTPVIYEKL